MLMRLFVVASTLALGVAVEAAISVALVPADAGQPSGYFVYRVDVTVDPGDDWLSAELYLDLCEECLFYQAFCNDQNPPKPFMFGSCPESQYTTFYTSPACWPNTQQSSNCVTITQLTETDTHIHVAWYDLLAHDGNTYTIGQITTMCPCECFFGWIRIWPLSTPGVYFEYPIDINNCGGGPDCNGNGVDDALDILGGNSLDCNDSGVPDECESGPYDVPPDITLQPQGAEINIGEPVSLYVGASNSIGHGQIIYQWYLDGDPIAGATSATYEIDYAAPFEAGDYHVVVEDGCGVNTSDVVTLVVRIPPSIVIDPMNDSVPIGGEFIATVSVDGSEPLSYQWRHNAIPLSDGGHISGANTPTLTVDPILAISDSGTYDIVITNDTGYVISEPAILMVTPGTCPPSDPPQYVKTYVLTGDANNTPWSWRIESTDGGFSDAVELNVPGVPSGGALAVAQQFADSINTYAAAHGCDIDQLLAQAREIAGQVVFSVGTGNNSPFELWVGAAGAEPDCLVVPEQLPACGFNPTITAAAPERSGQRNIARPEVTRPAESTTHDQVSIAPATVPSTPAAPETTTLAAASATQEEETHTIRLVRYDCRTGEQSVIERVHLLNKPRPPTNSMPPSELRRSAIGPEASSSFSGLTPIVDEGLPWSAICKIRYCLSGRTREASGVLVDAKHVLTSGLVVCEGGSGNKWAVITDIYPDYYDEDNTCSANAVGLWTFEDWLDDGKTQDMLGLIELDVPIGADGGSVGFVTEELGWYLEGSGYPNESPYTDGGLYGWEGNLDRYGRNPRIDRRSYYGMVGSPLYHVYTYPSSASVQYVHDWDDDESPTTFTGIDNGLYDGLHNMIAADKPADADWIPVQPMVWETDIPAGGPVSVWAWVFNYSTDPGDDQLPFDVHLYLSTDDVITASDLLLGTGTLDYEPDSWHSGDKATFWPDPTLPVDLPLGQYWIGVIIDVVDADTSNNDSSGRHAVPINVYCGAVPAPGMVCASKGMYSDRIEVQWAAAVNATEYEVWRSESTTPPAGPLATGITGTEYADYTAEVDVRYYYWVTARDECDNVSPLSAYSWGVCTNLNAPVVAASDGTNEYWVHVSWNAVDQANYYRVYRDDSPGDPNDAEPITGWQSALSVDDTDPDRGVAQYYWVRASSDDTGTVLVSGYSEPDVGWVALPAPDGVTASDAVWLEYVEVRWDEHPQATWFQTWRGPSSDPNQAAPVSDWTWGGTWYDRDYYDEDAVPGQTYYYFVRACKTSAGFPASDLSVPDSGWRILPAPVNVTATDGTETDSVIVTWSVISSGPLTYQVRKSRVSQPESYTYTTFQPEATWQDETAVPGVEYYYSVQAFAIGSGDHLSDFSDPDTGWRAEDCDEDGVPDHEDPDALPPTFVVHPAGAVACVGDSLTLSAQADSHIDVSYQWRKDGNPITNATEDSYTIGYVKPGHAGVYDVIASNSCGDAVSTPAVLAVMVAPAIEQTPADLTVTVDDPVTLTTIVSGDEPLTYLWRKGALPLSDDGRITGTTTPTLMIDPAELTDTGAYDLQVTNPCGSVISLPTMLTVELPILPPPGPPYAITTFEVTGDANGIPWSWRIESTDGTFQDTPLINVAGVGGGGAMAVANAFASSISAYVVSVGGGPTNIKTTVIGTIWGTAMLSISTGTLSPITLYVGPEDGPANCEVTATLPACGFNPLIDKILLPGQDCNLNGLDDIIDVLGGESTDVNGNNIPDECEAEPDQLHLVGPIPHELPVGGVGTIDATVQANFVGLPGWEVVFTKLTGSFTFTAGTVSPDGTQASLVTDQNGKAQMTFTADESGDGLIGVSVTDGNLPMAYSVFDIESIGQPDDSQMLQGPLHLEKRVDP